MNSMHHVKQVKDVFCIQELIRIWNDETNCIKIWNDETDYQNLE
jgi:hypothetical protein